MAVCLGQHGDDGAKLRTHIHCKKASNETKTQFEPFHTPAKFTRQTGQPISARMSDTHKQPMNIIGVDVNIEHAFE